MIVSLIMSWPLLLIVSYNIHRLVFLNFATSMLSQIPVVRGELFGSVFRCRSVRPGQGLWPCLWRLLLRSSGLEQERPEQGEIPDQRDQGLFLQLIFFDSYIYTFVNMCVMYIRRRLNCIGSVVVVEVVGSNGRSGVGSYSVVVDDAT